MWLIGRVSAGVPAEYVLNVGFRMTMRHSCVAHAKLLFVAILGQSLATFCDVSLTLPTRMRDCSVAKFAIWKTLLTRCCRLPM